MGKKKENVVWKQRAMKDTKLKEGRNTKSTKVNEGNEVSFVISVVLRGLRVATFF